MPYDKVPAVVTAMGLTVLPNVPGPTRDEWVGVAGGLLALLVRELLWWIRNRGK